MLTQIIIIRISIKSAKKLYDRDHWAPDKPEKSTDKCP